MKTKFTLGLLALVCCCSTSISAFAQQADHNGEAHCGTDAALRKLYERYPQLALDYTELMENNKQYILDNAGNRSSVVYTIPVVFHIIHEYGSENISDAQVIDQMAILNRDYRKLNADTATVVPEFQPVIADCRIQFKLANLDYKGDCTNGIEHIYSHETRNGDDFSKLNQWNRNKYLNVWVVDKMEPGVAGYAYYPSAVSGALFFADGIIILHNYVGSIGTSNVGSSRALTHEIGHWLSLSHTWGSTNDPVVACGDDGMQDTPVTKGHDNCSNRFDYFCSSASLDTLYNFSGVTTSSGAIDVTAVPTITSTFVDTAGAHMTPFQAVGLSANSSVNGAFGFSNWDLGANDGETVYGNLSGSINTAKYYEFTVTPVFGQAMTLTALSFNVARDTDGPRTYAVRASVGGFATNLTATINPANADLSVQSGNIFFMVDDSTTTEAGSRVSMTTGFVNVNQPITFRIYGFNAESGSGNFVVDDVKLFGTFGIVENVENYMEYSYCSKMFTDDQAFNMEAALNSSVSFRNNLHTQANLQATGTDGAPVLCTPQPDFWCNRRYICAGDNVSFTDESWRAAVTTRQWSFQDGTPATSTTANPTITFSTPGYKWVTLTVTNAAGTETLTRGAFIVVSTPWADVTGPYSEGFENNHFATTWLVDNPEENENKWQQVNYGAKTGSRAIMLNNFYTGSLDPNYFDRLGGNKDAAITAAYDLSHTTAAVLQFSYACATQTQDPDEMTEELKLYSSVDCGKTWQLRKTISDAALTNAGYVSGAFVPTSSQYVTDSYTIPVSLQVPRLRFKFEYTSSDHSNNIFLDDININGVLSTEDLTNDPFAMSVFPNPSGQGQGFNIQFMNPQTEATQIMITDVSGKLIGQQTLNAGQSLQVINSQSIASLTSGVYFVTLTSGGIKQTQRVVVY